MNHLRQQGTTLVELVISIVVIAVAISGAMLVMNRTTERSADPMIMHQAAALADAYLEEVLLKSFCDPDGTCNAGDPACPVCPVAEGNRAAYDNVCDYNGMNDNTGAKDNLGNAVGGLEAYNISVTVNSAAALGTITANQCRVLQVTVTVTHDSVADINYGVTGYRTNY